MNYTLPTFLLFYISTIFCQVVNDTVPTHNNVTTWLVWSEWSTCSDDCGSCGVHVKTRTCLSTSGFNII
uniref:Thrombospondin-related adhesive protein n=1 Tax=Heterorhabditis bacteriophora TaxID=37862 RepID=A0A1I7XED7_HETBA